MIEKLNDKQIEELYNYGNDLTKEECEPMSMEQFLVFIEKSYNCIEKATNEELFNAIKESIDRVTKVFKQGK